MEAGRGAPLALRLWVEALAWAPAAARWGRLVDVELDRAVHGATGLKVCLEADTTDAREQLEALKAEDQTP